MPAPWGIIMTSATEFGSEFGMELGVERDLLGALDSLAECIATCLVLDQKDPIDWLYHFQPPPQVPPAALAEQSLETGWRTCCV